MKVLVACEFSGVVRDAFRALGHDAWSCDLLPTELPGQHMQCDALEAAYAHDWDLMIAHPPCTYLSFAGNGYFNEEKYGEKAVERKRKRQLALEFFVSLCEAPVPKICVENPNGYPISAYRRPDQRIQPYYFGDRHLKTTCLWLKGLKPLLWWRESLPLFPTLYPRTATDFPEPEYIHQRKPSKNYKGGEIKKRYFTDARAFVNNKCKRNAAHERSRTFPGIAKAMAEQWGAFRQAALVEELV